MNTITLIGDSIRRGYEDTARREVAGIAELSSPKENGGNSRNVLAHLEEWVISRDPDIVHINCGLHDIKKEFGQSEAAVPLEEYEENVRRILNSLKSETTATVIWALMTPVNEDWHHRNKGFDRFEADVVSYNAAAQGIADELSLPVDDLFAIVQRAGRDNLLLPDGVHFKPEGYALLGEKVAEFIRQYLGMSR